MLKRPEINDFRELAPYLFSIKDFINNLLLEEISNSKLFNDVISENRLVFDSIKNFICGKSKRVRGTLFYLIFSAYSECKNWDNAYKALVSIELIHSFILIHDDIIDKSQTRRSNPTLHSSFNSFLKNSAAFNSDLISGSDFAIVAGDMIYAFAIHKFHQIKIEQEKLEKSLDILTKIAVYTAQGEFKEMLEVYKNINDVTKEDIYKIYKLKTANYTFSAPMLIANIFAGNDDDFGSLSQIAEKMGRAFQIKNDLKDLESFDNKQNPHIPKDLVEKKKTLLLYYAYNSSEKEDKKYIESFISSYDNSRKDYLNILTIFKKAGAIKLAEKEVSELKFSSCNLVSNLNISQVYKEALINYFEFLLT